jgi:hypothetical protein
MSMNDISEYPFPRGGERFEDAREVVKMLGTGLHIAEIGVWEGVFAGRLIGLENIERYYMLDPWRKLDRWNKPLNKSDERSAEAYRMALENTQACAEKRVILKGTTLEMIDNIPDGSLDLCYIDGDHTLKGITTDLICVWKKVRQGGWIMGDDASHDPWQHDSSFEPTLVYPFCRYFAEAMRCPIFMPGHNQFLIEKNDAKGHVFTDLTGTYERSELLPWFEKKKQI